MGPGVAVAAITRSDRTSYRKWILKWRPFRRCGIPVESATGRSGFPAAFAAASIAQSFSFTRALWIVAGLGDAPTMSGASSAVLLKVMLRGAFIAHSAASFHVSYFGGRPLRLRSARSLGASLFAAARIALIALPSYGIMSVGGLCCCMGLWGAAPVDPPLYFCKIMKQPRILREEVSEY